jgi:GGDEF domain-containing protein
MATSDILPRTIEELEAIIRERDARIEGLIWSDEMGMLNAAGLHDAISALPPGESTVIFADINRLKVINSVTGSHVQTNRYLRDGLRVRRGELAGQFLGDEFVFILPAHADAPAFASRITRQLASQPLSQAERLALEIADGVGARLGATFAWAQSDDVWRAVESLSRDVLAQKAQRDGR